MKKDVRIGIAQITSKREQTMKNIEKHENFARRAADDSVDLLVFPEMSITGYELELAEKQAIELQDSRLDELHRIAVESKMNIVVGVPLMEEEKLYIGSIVLMPDDTRKAYKKNYLHSSEDTFFNHGMELTYIELGEEKIGLGICYDIENEAHIKRLKEDGATVYVSSIFYSPKGMGDLAEKAQKYNKDYDMKFAISNYVGMVNANMSGGKSMFIDHQIKEMLNGEDEDLLIVNI